MAFEVRRREYNRRLPLDKREIIGHYCTKQDENGENVYDPSLSLLEYYKPPSNCRRVHFDLNLAYEQTRRKIISDVDKNSYGFFKWILLNFGDVYTLANDGKRSGPDFIAFRGLFRKLLCTLNDNDGWIITASKFENVIYLAEVETEEEKQRKLTETEMDKRRCTWGFKFEQFVLSESPTKDPKPEEPLDETEEFCCIFKSTLGKHKIICGAEMDGIISREEVKDSLKGKKIKFIELKTNRLLDTHWKLNSFKKYKSLKWWGQSYLVGINTIVCGLRDEEGIVKELKEFSLDEIAEMSKHIWNGNECREFCNEFLEFVKTKVLKDHNEVIYKFSWNPKVNRHIISVDKVDPNGDFKYLPEWYTSELKRLKNNADV